MILDFDNLAETGIIKDTPDTELPQNAWSDGENIRFSDGAVEKFKGHTQVFGTPSAAPYFTLPLQVESNYFWIYAGLTDIYLTDGTTHNEASKSTGAYSATADINWNGGLLGGGIAILNNGVDTPQQWTGNALTDNFSDLSNWPASMVARIIRPFKQFLIAADIDEGSGRDGQLLRWSQPADPDTVPDSWDYTDTTKDTGRTTLAETDDIIIDMMQLRDLLLIYKERSVWSMQFIGGNSIFAFRRMFDNFGAMSRRCIQPFFGKHFVLSTDDVIVHDGVGYQQILNNRWKRWLFGAIDGTNYVRSFVAPNYSRNEMWLCFPESGASFPNVALVWNWFENTVYSRELPDCAHIGYGVVDPTATGQIQDATGSYDEQVGVFDEQAASGAELFQLITGTNATKLFRGDDGEQFDSVNFTSYVERTALPLGRVGQNGVQHNPQQYKFVRRLWPRITGTNGGVINVYIGTRRYEGDSTSWTSKTFTIGTDTHVNFTKSGRLIDIKFESTTNITWKLHGYRVEYELGGIR